MNNEMKNILDIEAYKENPLMAWRKDLDRIRPRFIDTYILPGFMLWFAYASKSSMGRWPRRILFTGGMYMLYRNAKTYREALRKMKELTSVPNKTGGEDTASPQEREKLPI